jgi:virulence factor Mce-like protein
VRRRPGSSLVANPILVGAVAVLVTNVAVFLSWNANKGLPFVPTKQIKIELPNGANLLPGNEVREGGYRIGIVRDMKPQVLPGGEVGAVATLQIDQKQGEVPDDTRVAIRPRSVLGLKYVELERGSSKRVLPDGATLPVGRARIPVDLDEFFNIFDRKTREGSQKSLRGFGDAFASRGADLTRTIQDAPRVLRHLEPVMGNLAAPDTQLKRFFGELNDFTRTARPVADRYAHSFTAGADTFEAWSRDPGALQDTIEKSGPTMEAGTRSLRTQRPFLVALRDFSVALDGAAQEMPRALPRIIPALERGVPVLRRSPEVNDELRAMLAQLEDTMRFPGTGSAFRGLTATMDTLNPTLRFLGPYVTVCNYFNYSWTHVAEHLSEPDPTGTSQRTLLNQAGQQLDPTNRQRTGVTTLGAAYPANGGESNATVQHLHSNNYSAAVDNQGNADCESGQRGYVERMNAYGAPEAKTVVDPHLPGNSGTTFTGRPRVPAGQTFSRQPQVGPRIPAELDP